MKIHIELNNEEELIRFSYLMDRERNELAGVLFNQYKTRCEEAEMMLKKAQEKLSAIHTDNNQYHAIMIDDYTHDFIFSQRAITCFKHDNIFTIGDLLEKTELDLKKIPNMGNKTIKEIKEELSKHNLSLKG
jgi:DNA-directed RNA polymerase alpha subunit